MKKQALFFHLNAYLLLYFSINGHREILLGKAVKTYENTGKSSTFKLFFTFSNTV